MQKTSAMDAKSPLKEKQKNAMADDWGVEVDASIPVLKIGNAPALEANKPGTLTLAQAKEAVTRIMAEFKNERFVATVDKCRKGCSDHAELLANVVPLLFEVQGHVMAKYGFLPDSAASAEDADKCFGDFAQALQQHETDSQFRSLADEMKAQMKQLTAFTAPQAKQQQDGKQSQSQSSSSNGNGNAQNSDQQQSEDNGSENGDEGDGDDAEDMDDNDSQDGADSQN